MLTLEQTLAAPGQEHRSDEDRPLFGDRYEDRGLLARGGMGEVRRAWDHRLGREVVIKLLAWTRVDDPEARARFAAEASLTARLPHPGIVPVHDQGELADGRRWYAMAEVRGQTLRQVIDEAHAGGFDGEGLRRLVGLVRRLCEPLAFAHQQGVVHRDIKPANLMIGPFGEALVMDWGLALSRASAPGPAVVGTPMYMAPEQASRPTEVGPPADVYALGGVLAFALTGEAPRSGSPSEILARLRRGEAQLPPSFADRPIPHPLARVCARALDPDPAQRFPDAAALGAALEAWLAGEQRREEALAVLRGVEPLRPEGTALRGRAAALEAKARRIERELPPYASSAEKQRMWSLEDEAAQLHQAAQLRELRWLEGVRSALHQAPALPEAHDLLAEHYAAQLLDAEARRDPAAATLAEAMLAAHDRGPFAHLRAGSAPLTILTEPPGAAATLFRYALRGRRLHLDFVEELGKTPLVERPVALGSHAVRLALPGRHTVLCPVLLERGGAWDSRGPGQSSPDPIPLPPSGALGPDDCVVPAGWCWTGGDPLAPESLPLRRIWVPGFVMRRHPVTLAEYLDFLNALVAEGRDDEARAAAPRRGAARRSGEEALLIEPGPDGRYALGEQLGRAPVVMVSQPAALRYIQWLNQHTDEAWRLPNELEWEKAARGVDGRHFPWGDQPEPTWANLAGATREAPALRAVGGWPVDCSPYGVEGLAGNSRDWCANLWTADGPRLDAGRLILDVPDPADPGLRSVRGGAWQSTVHLGRAATRFAAPPTPASTTVGLRLVRALRGPWLS